MTQHLNLLPSEQRGVNAALVSLAVVLGSVLFVATLFAVNQIRLNNIERRLAASEADLQAAKQLLAQQLKAQGADLPEQIAALRPEAEKARQLLALADFLGNRQGFFEHFSEFGNAVRDGVWLREVGLGEAGKKVVLKGNALERQAVLDYGARLNERLAPRQIVFSQLELAPETFKAPSDRLAPVTTTRFVLR